jgi:hypothetical protein
MNPPRIELLAQALPLDDAVRIELREGVPIFRAPPRIQERIEELLEKRSEAPLSAEEEGELGRYEELDDLLGLVNRLVRNEMLVDDRGSGLARSA